MRRLILLAILMMFGAVGSKAQDAPGAEVSASYSYLRLGLPDGVDHHGGSISVAGNFNHWLGLVADVGGYHAAPFGVTLNTYTYMGGPRFSYRNSGRATPFVQVLLGGAHSTVKASGFSGSNNAFAFSAGAGLDVGLSKHLALRPQLDFIGMRFSGYTEKSVRASLGIVFRLGHR